MKSNVVSLAEIQKRVKNRPGRREGDRKIQVKYDVLRAYHMIALDEIEELRPLLAKRMRTKLQALEKL